MYKVRNLAVMASTGAALALGMVSSAMAELPPEATAAFTSVKTDATDMIAAGWPLLVAVTVGFVLMKLFKRGVNKAT